MIARIIRTTADESVLFSNKYLYNEGLRLNNNASNVIYTESKKMLAYALQQLQLGGVVRAGPMAAVGVVMIIVPVLFFVFSQSQILETMATSGLKE